jgi:magnesium transporter
MMDIYRRTLKNEQLTKITEPEKGSWISIVNPTQEELEKIAAMFILDAKTLNDTLDDNEFPRIETEENKTYVLIRVPTEENGAITTRPLLIILTDTNVITVSKMEHRLIDEVVNGRSDTYTTQKVKFLIQLFMRTSELYELYLNKISKDIRSKKYKLKELSDDDIMRLVEYEEVLNDFNSSFVPTVRLFNRLLDGKHLPLFRNDRELIQDLVINSQQTLDQAAANLRTIANVREAYSTVVSNSLNQRIKFLTVMTIALTFPTIIGSLYGMNVQLPLQQHPHAFTIILIAVTVTLTVFLIGARMRKWI